MGHTHKSLMLRVGIGLATPRFSERPFRGDHPLQPIEQWVPGGSPSEISAATVRDRGALVSFGFPSRQALGGSPLLQRSQRQPYADPEATQMKV